MSASVRSSTSRRPQAQPPPSDPGLALPRSAWEQAKGLSQSSVSRSESGMEHLLTSADQIVSLGNLMQLSHKELLEAIEKDGGQPESLQRTLLTIEDTLTADTR